jgi:hypothetical protein
MNDFENRLSTTLRNVADKAPGAAGLEAATRSRLRRRRQTRLTAGVVVAVAALPLAGFLTGLPSTTSTDRGPASSPSGAVSSTTPSPSEGPAYFGDTRMSDLGEITVHAVEFPVSAQSLTPETAPAKGNQLGALDLEVCSDGSPLPDGAPGRYSATEFWIIEAWIGGPDDGPVQYSVGNSTDAVVREPSLSDAQLAEVADGTCERGWLTFELPRGTKIGRVAYTPWQATPLMWRPE